MFKTCQGASAQPLWLGSTVTVVVRAPERLCGCDRRRATQGRISVQTVRSLADGHVERVQARSVHVVAVFDDAAGVAVRHAVEREQWRARLLAEQLGLGMRGDAGAPLLTLDR